MSQRWFVAIRFPLALFAFCWLFSFTGCQDRQAARIVESDSARSEMEMCQRWKTLKNEQDPKGDELLAPNPAAPNDPISPEEADRLQANWFLRQQLRIVSVRPTSSGRFVLATEGNVSAPTLQVRTPTGVDRIQRTMFKPDLIVEVRDGKIHGVRAETHSAP